MAEEVGVQELHTRYVAPSLVLKDPNFGHKKKTEKTFQS